MIPVVPIIVGSAVGSAVSTVVGSFVGPLVTPTQRQELVLSNMGRPNSLPTLDALFSAWSRGHISTNQLIVAATTTGAVVANPQQMRAAFVATNFSTPARAAALVEYAGANQHYAALWQAVASSHIGRPGVGDVLSAYHSGLVSPDQLPDRLMAAGTRADIWERILPLYAAVPTHPQLIIAAWRDAITPDEYRTGVRRLGYSETISQRVLDVQLQPDAPISDLIRFVVREAFSPDVAGPLRYYSEIPDEFRRYAARQGYGWNLGFDIPADGGPRPATWADLYWASHWLPISPTQSYMMLHRLRPGRIGRYEEMLRAAGVANPQLQPFTMGDVRRWLKVNDYPPTVRDQLAAISYSVMRLVDIRQVFKLGIRDRQWALDQLLDRGYVLEDARLTVEFWERQNAAAANSLARRERDKAAAELVRQAREGLRLGYVRETDFRQSMAAIGLAADAVDMIVTVENNRFTAEEIKATLQRVRREILSGNLTEQQGRAMLAAAGFRDDYAGRYARQARLAITPRRQQANTAQVVKWVGRGTMSPAEGQRRLVNLGWQNADIALLLAESQGQFRQLQAKATAEVQKATDRRVRGLEKSRKDAINLRRQVEADLRRISPITTVRKLLDNGVISERRAIQRLLSQGYPPEAVQEYLALWRRERGSGQDRQATAGTSAGQEPQAGANPAGPGGNGDGV